MKIALIHDYIKEYGGAERVLETLHEMYPEAEVYTLVYYPKFLGPHKERFRDWKIHTSFLQNIPYGYKLISIFRLFAPFIFKSFNLSKYDVAIVSATGAYIPNAIEAKKHICYCHTPPRYLYGYATAREWKKNIVVRIFAEAANHFLRLLDFNAAQNVDQFIANSEEVKARIEKFYRKDAVVVYPPIDVNSKFEIRNSKLPKKYFLAGGRLARPKHFELIIRAANELKLPLKIFGKGFAGYGEELKQMGGPTIEFVGEISDEEKLSLMNGAKAFFMASEDEDFGIVPVEAMGMGCPVIAYRSGGVKETVLQGRTGVFFEELNAKSIKEAVKRFEKLKLKPENCIAQANKFSRENFEKEVRSIVENI